MRKLIVSLIALLIVLPFSALAEVVTFDVSKDPTASDSAWVGGDTIEVRVPSRTSSAITVEFTNSNLPAGAMPLPPTIEDSSYTIHLYLAEAGTNTLAANHGTGGDFACNTTAGVVSTDGVGGLGYDLTAVSNTFLTHADDANFDVGTGTFALGCWFKHDTISTAADYLFNKRDGSGNTQTGYAAYMDSDGTLGFRISDDGGVSADVAASTGTYDDNAWHHAWFVRESSNVKIYVDGSLDGSTAISNATGTLSTSAAINIGAIKAATNAWAGQLDSVEMIKADYPTAPDIETHWLRAKEALNPAKIRSTDSAVTISSASAATPELFLIDMYGDFRGYLRLKSSASQTSDIECEIK